MTAEAVLARLPVWRETPELAPVEGGRTNRNFIIRDGEAAYFGRVGVDLPHHGISRANEQLCAGIAAARGVAPHVHYAADGILVTRFVQGDTLRPQAMHDAGTLREVAALLRRLHAEPANEPALLPRCGIAASLAYLAMVRDDELPVSRRRIMDRLGAPATGGDRLVHCDIIPENLIRSTDGMMLIDWEYAGVGVAEIDLASVIVNADLDAREAALLLDGYGPCDPALLERQRFALVVREALWCMVQSHHTGPTDELAGYTRRCIDRMSREFA